MRKPLPSIDEPLDEKTPVSNYSLPSGGKLRDSAPPRPAATRLSHLPIQPRSSKKMAGINNLPEPSIVVGPGVKAEVVADPQSDTVHMVRRLHTRKLELVLLAAVGALLAAAITLWLAQWVGGSDSPAADRKPSFCVISLKAVGIAAARWPFDRPSIGDKR